MIKRSKPIKRSNKPRQKRAKPRRGDATDAEKARVRLIAYERSGGRCELRLKCKGTEVLAFEGSTPWDHGHAVHLKSKGAGGKWTPENIKWGCPACHLVGLHVEGGKGKIVPAKDRGNRSGIEDRVEQSPGISRHRILKRLDDALQIGADGAAE